MQNDCNFIIFYLSCYKWYCGGIISSSFHIYINSFRIRIVVKFHKHALGLPYGCMHSAMVLSSTGAPLGEGGAIPIGFWYDFYCTDYTILDKIFQLCPSIWVMSIYTTRKSCWRFFPNLHPVPRNHQFWHHFCHIGTVPTMAYVSWFLEMGFKKFFDSHTYNYIGKFNMIKVQMNFFNCRIWACSKNQEDRHLPFLKGQLHSKNKLSSNERAWKCQKMSPNWPQCAKWFPRYLISKSGIWARWKSPFWKSSASFSRKYDVTNAILQENEKMKVQHLTIYSISLKFCGLLKLSKGILLEIKFSCFGIYNKNNKPLFNNKRLLFSQNKGSV